MATSYTSYSDLQTTINEKIATRSTALATAKQNLDKANSAKETAKADMAAALAAGDTASYTKAKRALVDAKDEIEVLQPYYDKLVNDPALAEADAKSVIDTIDSRNSANYQIFIANVKATLKSLDNIVDAYTATLAEADGVIESVRLNVGANSAYQFPRYADDFSVYGLRDGYRGQPCYQDATGK